MKNNQIQQSGASSIADLIRNNKTIKRIDLRWNDLGRQGASVILQAVQESTMIQYVDLTGNKGTEEVAHAMQACL